MASTCNEEDDEYEDVAESSDTYHVYDEISDSIDTQIVTRTPEECANEIRIVLVGRTGNGKSATGNSILRKNCFYSEYNPNSVTTKCKKEEFDRGGKKVIVVDTPGLFDTKKVADAIRREIVKCIGISAPGPHAIIYVLSMRSRLTEEEINTFVEIRTIFGEELFNHVIFLFTGKDELDRQNVEFKVFLRKMPKFFLRIWKKCHYRSVAFNNLPDVPEYEKRQQIENLFSIVNEITEKDEGKYFTNQMILDTEQVIFDEFERLLKIAKQNESYKDDKTIKAQIRANIRDKILTEGGILRDIEIAFGIRSCSIL